MCEGTQPTVFEKGGFIKEWGMCALVRLKIQIWVDKDLFECWKHAHFTLDVIDAFGVGGFL
jgi:uncharacterized protein (DUF779 family)